MDLADWSLCQLRSAIAGGEVRPQTALECCLERIATLDSGLNAFISVEADAAREAAQSSADTIRSGQQESPLGGIPIAIKDLVDVEGTVTTGGSRVPDPIPAARDAEAVRRIRNAGAVLVGKTNLHEFAYGASGAISAFGPTRNPLDPSRIPGGSSSGSAAAVASGMCFGALGTDTAGSIRLPAACCGIVGFKPTWGRVPVAGVIPLAWSFDHVGPLARSVNDAAILFGALVEEPLPGSFGSARPSLKCGVARKFFCEDLEPEVAAAFEGALETVEQLGWTLQDVELEVETNRTVSNAESWAYHASFVESRADRYDPRTLARIRSGAKVTAEEYIEGRRQLELLRERNRQLPGGCDLVLTPTCPMLPPSIEVMSGTGEVRAIETRMLRNTRPFNVLGWPAISLPIPTSANSLVAGLQIAAPFGQDWALLCAAREIEALFTAEMKRQTC